MNSLGRSKIFELILVPCFAFLPSLISSMLIFVRRNEHVQYENVSSSISFFLFYECSALLLLYYVLYRRYETFGDLGLSFTWRQLLSGVILSIIAFAIVYTCQWILIKLLPASYLKNLHPKNTDFIPTNFSLLFYIFLLINAFAEELIVRAFVIREVISLTNNKAIAVLISVIFQASYHLYQGLLPALITGVIFLVYSIFFVRTGKILPVIVAHIIMDMIAVIMKSH